MFSGNNRALKFSVTILFILFFLSLFYSLGNKGTCFGTHSYQLILKAIWEDGSFKLNRFAQMGLVGDHSERNGNIYAHCVPGPGILPLPFYALGDLTQNGKESIPVQFFCGKVSRATVLFYSVCASLLVLLLYFSIIEILPYRLPAITICFIFGFGFYTWGYASMPVRHLPTALLVLFAVYCGIKCRKDPENRSALWGMSFCAGMLPLFEYVSIIMLPALFGLGFPAIYKNRKNIRNMAGALLLFCVGAGLFSFYHTACFGLPWKTSYSFSATHTWSTSVAGTFSGSMLSGLKFLFINDGTFPEIIVRQTGFPENFLNYYRRQTFIGLFTLYPYLWFAIPGLLIGLISKKTRRAFFWMALLILPTILLISSHKALFGGPFDGKNFEPRYLYHLTPVLFLWVAATIGWVISIFPKKQTTTIWLSCLTLLVLSIQGFRYNIVKGLERAKIIPEYCRGVFPMESETWKALFPNRHYLDESLLILLAIFLIPLLILTIHHFIKNRQ